MVFTYVISDDWAGVELNFYHDNAGVNHRRFKELESKKEEIEEKFDSIAWHYSTKWLWDFKEDRNHQRILYKFTGRGLNEEYRWNHLTTLIVDGMRCFVASLENYLEDLD